MENAWERWFLKKVPLDQGKEFAITSGIVAEFVHVVTDQLRFDKPPGVDEALDWSRFWSDAREVTGLWLVYQKSSALYELPAVGSDLIPPEAFGALLERILGDLKTSALIKQ